METLLLHKEMYGLSAAVFRRTVDELSEMLEVGHLLRVQVRKLSLGERMKMELLAALVHRPAVLFLDELGHEAVHGPGDPGAARGRQALRPPRQALRPHASLHWARHGRAGSMRTTLIPRGPGIWGQLTSI